MTTTPSSPALRLLFWESTSRCNLACRHCRRQDTDDASADRDMTAAQGRGMLADVATLGRSVVVFSGGEPLLRDDWSDLAGYARDLGLPTALATNGTLIDTPMAQAIARAGFHRVSVSLDGADAATHDAFRGLAGSFAAAADGCRRLVELGVPLQINCTIARHNVDQLDMLAELARRLGAMAMHLFLLVPVGCGVELAESHRISPDKYEDVLRWVLRERRNGQLEVRATCAPHFQRVQAGDGSRAACGSLPDDTGDSNRASPKPLALSRSDCATLTGCLGGVTVAFVSHRGEVFPCGYLPVPAGVLDADGGGFSRIWRESDVFSALRDRALLKGKCGRCDYRQACGGCRARAYAATGDYLASEPMCAYQPS